MAGGKDTVTVAVGDWAVESPFSDSVIRELSRVVSTPVSQKQDEVLCYRVVQRQGVYRGSVRPTEWTQVVEVKE